MPQIGPLELILILLVALLVIGPGKLPEVGAALGKSIREFRKATTDVQDSVRMDFTKTPTPPQEPAAPPSAQAVPPQASVPPPVPAAPIEQPPATGSSSDADRPS